MKGLKIILVIAIVAVLLYVAYKFLYPQKDELAKSRELNDPCEGLTGIRLKQCLGQTLTSTGFTSMAAQAQGDSNVCPKEFQKRVDDLYGYYQYYISKQDWPMVTNVSLEIAKIQQQYPCKIPA